MRALYAVVLACTSLSLAYVSAAGCALNTSGILSGEETPQGQAGGLPGTGGSAGGSISSSSSGTPPQPEQDCGDGIDNDSDGASDCDDTDCTDAGFTCIEAIPANAKLVYVSSTAGTCETLWEPLSLIECGACACSPPALACSLGVWTYTDSQCNTQYGVATITQPECANIDDLTRYSKGLAYPPDNYACAPVAAQASSTDIGACVASGTSTCGNQGLCLPKPTDKLCALYSGNIACAAPFSQTKAVFQSPAGTACQCSCETAGASCMGSVLSFYNGSNSCNGNLTNIPLDGQCHPANYATSVNVNPGTATASCTAASAPAAGDMNVQTLCCMP